MELGVGVFIGNAGTCFEGGLVISLDLSNLNLSRILSPDIARQRFLINLTTTTNSFSGPTPRISPASLASATLTSPTTYSTAPSLSSSPPSDTSRSLTSTTTTSLGLSPSRSLGSPSTPPTPRRQLLHRHHPPGVRPVGAHRVSPVSGNKLVGPIPPEIGNLSTLQQLYVSYFNSYDGGIPDEIGNLSNLVHLDMANCGLSGEIPRRSECS
ncbi:hypothetical protein QJS10_CPA05g01641 [Acorus calamus]|uniref:Uncharacterized protein n=1 Tax=Acorus calamus TaxID=4465 RepID=A0AAV9ET90_ACOCL|nr:hypothetical protein QJS10_CPA05g01641 [Acorus calamus]